MTFHCTWRSSVKASSDSRNPGQGAEGLHGFIQFGRNEWALFGGDQLVRAHFTEPDTAILEVELDAVAVTKRRAGNSTDARWVDLDFCRAAQGFQENFLFIAQLAFVAGMLVLASTAPGEYGADGRDTVR
jgi:hypothetical protein